MAYIGDDKVIIFGGISGNSFAAIDETWVYDLSDNSWTQKYCMMAMLITEHCIS
jgi:protein gp37